MDRWTLSPALVSAGLCILLGLAYSSPVPVKVQANSNQVIITHGTHYMKVDLSKNYGNPRNCSSSSYEACVTWGESMGPLLLVSRTSKNRFTIELNSFNDAVKVTFNLTGRHLYGGPLSNHWPAETAIPIETLTPYITGAGSVAMSPIAVAERLWFTSDGEAFKVPDEAHLFFTQTADELALYFENKPPYTSDSVTSKVQWCLGGVNAKQAYSCWPQKGRDVQKEMIRSPIWSTWVRYKAAVDQNKVLEMVKEVKDHGFPISTIEIDDKWETCYGNHLWDLSKFPNPKAMVEELKSLGLLVTLWVHPFINEECSYLNDVSNYMVKDPRTDEVAIVSWWNGNGGLINFTDPKAQNWFIAGLKSLQKDYGLSGFKFDAGEAKYIGGLMDGYNLMTEPNAYTRDYVNTAARMGMMGEVRVGSGNANTQIFQRLQDTNTYWEANLGGLQSVIPNVLTLNALGYPAVIPDMVGGNMYSSNIDEELFIRWLQVNTFLPVIQFSIAPWNISKMASTLALELCALHEKYASKIIAEIRNSNEDGRRAISPVWWIDPNDKTAQTIDSEFLLGENILVAPVVQKSATSRDIYLPRGKWADGNNGTIYQGRRILKNYPAPIYVLPYFIKQEKKEVNIVKGF